MQVRAAITRGDVQAALAGIERIDPEVGAWAKHMTDAGASPCHNADRRVLLTPAAAAAAAALRKQLLARDGRLAFSLRLQHLLELVRQVFFYWSREVPTYTLLMDG